MKKFVNILTISRIVATFLLPVIWHYLRPLYIFIFVTLILLTDFFDGMLARKFRVQSLFGTIMDVVADKLFGMMIILTIANYLPIFYILFILEMGIALINITAVFLGATTKSSFLGKTKMWFLGISILLGILYIFSSDILRVLKVNEILWLFDNLYVLINSSVFVTAGAEIMVATDYARHIIKELKKQNNKIKYKFKSKEELKYVLFDTEYCLKHKDEPYYKSLLK